MNDTHQWKSGEQKNSGELQEFTTKELKYTKNSAMQSVYLLKVLSLITSANYAFLNFTK